MSRRADPTPWANALTLLLVCAMAGSWASARVSAGEGRQELARRHYGRGRELMRQGDYVSAGKSFRLAVMASPNDRSLKLGFGMALLAMGDYAYAAYCARRVSSAYGDPTAADLQLASFFPSPDAFGKQVRRLEEHVERSPRDVDALTVLAFVHFHSGKKAEAAVALDSILKLDVKDVFARAYREHIDLPQVAEEPPPTRKDPPLALPSPPTLRFPVGRRAGIIVTYSDDREMESLSD